MQVTMNNYWTNIKIYFISQQLLALIIIYSMSLHIIQFVPKVSLVSVSLWLVSVLFFWATLYSAILILRYLNLYDNFKTSIFHDIHIPSSVCTIIIKYN